MILIVLFWGFFLCSLSASSDFSFQEVTLWEDVHSTLSVLQSDLGNKRSQIISSVKTTCLRPRQETECRPSLSEFQKCTDILHNATSIWSRKVVKLMRQMRKYRKLILQPKAERQLLNKRAATRMRIFVEESHDKLKLVMEEANEEIRQMLTAALPQDHTPKPEHICVIQRINKTKPSYKPEPVNGVKHSTTTEPVKHEHSTKPEAVQHEHSTKPEAVQHEHSTKPEHVKYESTTKPETVKHEHSTKPYPFKHKHGTNSKPVKDEYSTKSEPTKLKHVMKPKYVIHELRTKPEHVMEPNLNIVLRRNLSNMNITTNTKIPMLKTTRSKTRGF